MEQAVDCIEQAIREKKRITVYGDYDCDGVCGCARCWRPCCKAQAQRWRLSSRTESWMATA